MRIGTEERFVFSRIHQLAIYKLRKHDSCLPHDFYLRYAGDFAYVSFPYSKQRFMLKLCPSFWERQKIQLTMPELQLLKEMDGIVFLLGKATPPEVVRPCDYEFLLLSSAVIQEEALNHLKSVESACFFKFLLTFYNSRLYTWGSLI